MKKYLLIFFVLLTLTGYGQAPTNSPPNENSVVKDAAGTALPYATWMQLIRTGEYSLRRSAGSTEYVLHKGSPEEKAASNERLKAFAPRPSDAFKKGEKFKGEKFSDINGNKFDLRNISDKIYVINFWFINCAPCKKEIPELNELVKQYQDNKNVVFLAIALDSRFELKEFLKTMPFNYNIIDDGRYFAQKYGVTAYPTHVVIGKDGLIKFSTVGLAANTVYWVEKTIKEQLANP